MPAVSIQPSQSVKWEDFATQRNGQWKPVLEGDQQSFDCSGPVEKFSAVVDSDARADAAGPESTSHQLTADEAAQILIIGASRVKVTGPKASLPYRKLHPLGEFWITLSSDLVMENIKKVAAVGTLVVAAGFFSQNPAVVKSHLSFTNNWSVPNLVSHQPVAVHRSVKSAPVVASNARPIRPSQPTKTTATAPASAFVAASRTTAFSASAASSRPAWSQPVIVQPLTEYQGPSSVTGITLPHRRAYQTSSMIVRPVQ